MRRFTVNTAVVLSLVLTFAASSAASADDTAVKEAIADSFHKAINAIERHDVKRAMLMYAPGYLDKTPGAKPETDADREKSMREAIQSLKTLIRADMDVDKVVVTGETAVASTTTYLEIELVDLKGELGAKGKVHNVVSTVHHRDTYVNIAGRWRLKEALQRVPEPLVVDGKRFTPPMPPAPATPPATKKPAK